MYLEYILSALAPNFTLNVKKALRMYTIFVYLRKYRFVLAEQRRLSKFLKGERL
jgi:hypothetical protein